MVEQIITKIKDDMEAARLIDQALVNLPESYPYRDMAHRAFGFLILGGLGLKPKKHIMVIPEKEGDTILIRYE